MSSTNSTAVFDALLDRLYASLVKGPAINCYPGNSRQRVDLQTLASLSNQAVQGSAILQELMGQSAKFTITPTIDSVPAFKADDEDEPEEIKKARKSNAEKLKLLKKLFHISKDADVFQKDTGNYILYLGYPLLCMQPAAGGGRKGPNRIISPLAFIPVGLTVNTGARPKVELACLEKGAERLIPNSALRIWVERQLELPYPDDLFNDEEGSDPVREVRELVEHVCSALKITAIPDLSNWPVNRLPSMNDLTAQNCIFPGAVLGLYQLRNQSIIRDMESLRGAETLPQTVAPFITINASLIAEEDFDDTSEASRPTALLAPKDEHLIDRADPCQRRAVIRARNTKGLVVHGPPGTGKSQTITNMIGDYLARDKKVLLVCEKRTALDVVLHRLEARGLGTYCCMVHDAQRDRMALYKAVRDDLENLADLPMPQNPARELSRINGEIERIDLELRELYATSNSPDQQTGMTLHELVGEWLLNGALKPNLPELAEVEIEDVLSREGEIRRMYRRLLDADYAENSWRERISMDLTTFMTRDLDSIRSQFAKAIECCTQLEKSLAVLDEKMPFPEQSKSTETLAGKLEELEKSTAENLRAFVGNLGTSERINLARSLKEMAPLVELLTATGPLATDLKMTYQLAQLPAQEVGGSMAKLATYLAKCQSFFGFLQFGVKKEARSVLTPFGLTLTIENAQKVKSFFEGVHLRNQLQAYFATTLPQELSAVTLDEEMVRTFEQLTLISNFLEEVNQRLSIYFVQAVDALADAKKLMPLIVTLKQRTVYAVLAETALNSLLQMNLLTVETIHAFRSKVCHGKSVSDDVIKLSEDVEKLENLLRFEAESASLSPIIKAALQASALNDVEEDIAWRELISGIYYHRAKALINNNPKLQLLDPTRIEGHFQRLAELHHMKRDLEVSLIIYNWTNKQKQTLLSKTGTRLNTLGTELKRRLTMRGKNASRIREVIHSGLSKEQSDPLFDMRPIWMVNPETAAQIFPLEPLFDAVIFDEASQCRLEEGLPVLSRGHSVIIAGDTKQLPPTSFFQASVASSTDSMDLGESEDELFQAQQSDIEDLLSAALNIEIDQSYLDVHYRSVSPDLIQFSNASFYGSRLQAIPGHPNNIREEPAVQLIKVAGVLDERCNRIEAMEVVKRVKGLLRRDDPPSIGIVTFNLPQKDLIEELLDAEAEADNEFRQVYSQALERMGEGSFEGLFVKNLENVQGDERDYIILSTTFAPASNGKFYKRFGPLATTGGERRLNVIITRARYQVDLVTSIPSDVYRGLGSAVLPEGKRPNGAMYLMQYICMAEDLADSFQRKVATDSAEEVFDEPALYNEQEVNVIPEEVAPHVVSWPCTGPSSVVEHFSKSLLENQTSSVLYYANDGFAVDLALKDSENHKLVTVGYLFDTPRYKRAEDMVEWDYFRRGIFSAVGWEIKSVWSTQLIRDLEGVKKLMIIGTGK